MAESLERVRAIKRAHEQRWLTLAGVVAVGIGQRADGSPQIIVSAETDSARIRREIPEQVEGVPVEIRVTGPLRAL
ncbi:MAG: hypothetical protein ACR2H9_02075 [Longimicrobiaceae bacterium]|jgi:hypothetical protein